MKERIGNAILGVLLVPVALLAILGLVCMVAGAWLVNGLCDLGAAGASIYYDWSSK